MQVQQWRAGSLQRPRSQQQHAMPSTCGHTPLLHASAAPGMLWPRWHQLGQPVHPAASTLSRQPVAASAASAINSGGSFMSEGEDPPSNLFKATLAHYQRFVGLTGKFMPMVGLFFLLAFCNTILDSLKDTLVITATGGGAQVIPYLTVYAVLPSSLAFLVLYSLASQRMSRPALFNAIIAVFMAFFTAFAFVLYPNQDILHPHALADQMSKALPQGVEGLVGMFRNWTFTLFFCMSELWGDVCLGLLFWGLANDTTKLADAPTLYPLFGLGANVAQALGGTVLKVFSSGMAIGGTKAANGDFGAKIQALMLVVVVFMVAALFLHAYIDRKHRESLDSQRARQAARVLRSTPSLSSADSVSSMDSTTLRHASMDTSDSALESRRASHSVASSSAPSRAARSTQPDAAAASSTASSANGTDSAAAAPGKEASKKAKPSVGEIFKVLAASVPIRCLAIMSLAQGLCTSLMEFAWKSHIGLLFPSPQQFTGFLGDVSMWQGVVTGCLMVLSPAMFQRLGWSGVAAATPRVLLLGGSCFFASCMLYQYLFASHAAESLAHAALHMAQDAAAGAGGVAAVAEKLAVGAEKLTAGTGGLVLQVLVYGGALLYVFSKSAKFSLFKPAEEMVYISLDEEGRTKGKAAIDVVGSQAGKSGGSILQQVLLVISGGAIAGILPVMAICYFAMAQGWLKSVATLRSHADYGHADSVHASVQAQNLESLDEDDDHGRGGNGAVYVQGGGNGNGAAPLGPTPPIPSRSLSPSPTLPPTPSNGVQAHPAVVIPHAAALAAAHDATHVAAAAPVLSGAAGLRHHALHGGAHSDSDRSLSPSPSLSHPDDADRGMQVAAQAGVPAQAVGSLASGCHSLRRRTTRAMLCSRRHYPLFVRSRLSH